MTYSPEIEHSMRMFYDSLSEKDRRRYAAIEAAKLGHGGLEYISTLLGCDPKTIRQGQNDLDQLPDGLDDRVRKTGGGRKLCLDTIPQLEENFLRILQDRTAGDPMRQEVRWTGLTYEQIAGHLAEAGTPVSVPVVKQLLEKHGYVTRKAQKSEAMGGHADQNQQFENIARLKREYLESEDPIVSMDTKKKELIGNFYRPGQLLTQGVIGTFDHDFPSFAGGVIIPHGLYDVKQNDGHVNLGTSHDTGEFACDSLERWWQGQGRELYPRGDFDPAAVRRRRQQQRQPLPVQGGSATAGRSAGDRDPCGALPTVLLEVQPDRTSAVPAPDPGLPGSRLRERGVGEGVDGEGEDEHGAAGDGGHPGQGVPDGAEVCGGIQGGNEDRVRQNPPEVELQGHPERVMTPGSY